MCTLIPGRLEGAGPELRSEVAGAVVLAVALQEVQGLQLQERGGGRRGGENLITFIAYANHKETLTTILKLNTCLLF